MSRRRFWKLEIAERTFEPLWLGVAIAVSIAALLPVAGVPSLVAVIVAVPVGLGLGVVGYGLYVRFTAKPMLVDPSPEDVAGKAVPLRRRRRKAR